MNSSSPPPTSAFRWRQWLKQRLEVDRAVFYAVAVRGWQFVSGLITLVLIARYFSRELQGYFYTFWSLVALQSFLELGFSTVIINTSSHEWSELYLDDQRRIAGAAASRSRLISLGRLAAAWYAGAALLFALLIGPAGAAFLAHKAAAGIAWWQPWTVVVLLSSLSLATIPFHAILEGCHQVATVNRFRLWQAICGSLAMWASLAFGAGLWTTAVIAAVKLAWEVYLIGWHYRRFFAAFWVAPSGPILPWRQEIWPLQWRLAIQGVFSYFSSAMLTPVMYYFHGPVAAGQMGMTWNVCAAIQAVAIAWVQTRVPVFGRLIARRQYPDLDRLFRRLVLVSWSIIGLGSLAFAILVIGLNFAAAGIARNLTDRFIGPGALVLLLMALVLQHVPHCQSYYIRAHKREPLLVLSIVVQATNALAIPWFSWYWGAAGAASALLATTVLILIPWQMFLWRQCRRER